MTTWLLKNWKMVAVGLLLLGLIAGTAAMVARHDERLLESAVGSAVDGVSENLSQQLANLSSDSSFAAISRELNALATRAEVTEGLSSVIDKLGSKIAAAGEGGGSGSGTVKVEYRTADGGLLTAYLTGEGSGSASAAASAEIERLREELAETRSKLASAETRAETSDMELAQAQAREERLMQTLSLTIGSSSTVALTGPGAPRMTWRIGPEVVWRRGESPSVLASARAGVRLFGPVTMDAGVRGDPRDPLGGTVFASANWVGWLGR